MLRFVLLFVGLLLIWVLFFSKYEKTQKIIITLVSSLLIGCWLGWEMQRDALSTSLIDIDEITICSVKLTHSYRTNYDAVVCLENTSDIASAERVKLRYSALVCDPNCTVIEEIDKERLIQLPNGKKTSITESVRFDLLDAAETKKTPSDVQWKVSVLSVQSSDKKLR